MIVVVGPPLAGKSTIAQRAASALGFAHLDVDCVSSRDGDRDPLARYERMHAEASALVRQGATGIVLSATYAARPYRESAVRLAETLGADLFLVECRVSASEAVARRAARRDGHPATDLSPERVHVFARNYPYHDGGVTIDTSHEHEDVSVARVVTHVGDRENRLADGSWRGSGVALDLETQLPEEASGTRIASGISRRRSVALLVWHGLVGLLVLGLATAGCVFLLDPTTPDDIGRATGWLTVSLVVAALVGVFEFLVQPSVRRALDVLRAGSTPQYGVPAAVAETNADLYVMYAACAKGADLREKMPLPASPLYFVIPPEPGKSFDVRVTSGGEAWDESRLATLAADKLFDWRSYAEWRYTEIRRQFYGLRGRAQFDRVLRVTDIGEIDPNSRAVSISGISADFRDYLVAEQSVHIRVDRQVPYLREFFEGEAWGRGDVNLDDLRSAAERYSLVAGVAVVLTTVDGFLVLQRRSSRVLRNLSGLGASASGTIRWSDVDGDVFRSVFSPSGVRRRRVRTVKQAALRQLREEIGVAPRDLLPNDTPFVAAAFNLRYGRDLNFYCHLTSRLSRDEIARRFVLRRRPLDWLTGAYRDRWEVAHLVFVPVEAIGADGVPNLELNEMLGDSRHVRGALHAFGVSGRRTHVLETLSTT